jgi:hypothetical protein
MAQSEIIFSVQESPEGGTPEPELRAHKQLRVGTLGQILADIATNLELTREELIEKLLS